MASLNLALFCLVLLLTASCLALGLRPPLRSARVGSALCMGSYCDSLLQTTPNDAKAGLKLILRGSSIASAVFRADLKKELVFFRGCAAEFKINRDGNEGVLVAEGKTASLLKALEWMRTMELPQSERKANFQGPSVQIITASGVWQAFGGKLVGFSAPEPPPLEGAHIQAQGQTEAASMTGTDESV